MELPGISFQLPTWVQGFLEQRGTTCVQPLSRMELAIELSRQNVVNGTGGPFGAAVFDDLGTLVSVGVNAVVSSRCSIFHAEIVALALAQKRLGTFDLRADSSRYYELYTSTEPCAMCFGAIPWSGINTLVCAARDQDARDIGFDEGPKLANWTEELEARSITVTRDVLRQQAVAVLKDYKNQGGHIYNPGSGLKPPD